MVLLFLQTLPFCIFISFKVLGSKCLRIEGLLFWYASSLSTYITFFLFFKYHYFLHAFLYFAETAYGFNCVFVTFLGPEWLSVILNVAFSSSSFFFIFFLLLFFFFFLSFFPIIISFPANPKQVSDRDSYNVQGLFQSVFNRFCSITDLDSHNAPIAESVFMQNTRKVTE